MQNAFRDLLTSLLKQYPGATGARSEQIEIHRMPDENDVASMHEAANMEMINRSRNHDMIKKINIALLKISQGDYGYCDDCGAEIGEKRLEVIPTACLCIPCLEISEQKSNQFGRRAA